MSKVQNLLRLGKYIRKVPTYSYTHKYIVPIRDSLLLLYTLIYVLVLKKQKNELEALYLQFKF